MEDYDILLVEDETEVSVKLVQFRAQKHVAFHAQKHIAFRAQRNNALSRVTAPPMKIWNFQKRYKTLTEI